MVFKGKNFEFSSYRGIDCISKLSIQLRIFKSHFISLLLEYTSERESLCLSETMLNSIVIYGYCYSRNTSFDRIGIYYTVYPSKIVYFTIYTVGSLLIRALFTVVPRSSET